jgi:hypothetical protein
MVLCESCYSLAYYRGEDPVDEQGLKELLSSQTYYKDLSIK